MGTLAMLPVGGPAVREIGRPRPLTCYAAGGGGGFGGLGGGGFGGLGCSMGATLSRLWPPRRRRET